MTQSENETDQPKKDVRKLDGSGRGVRANAGRGGCDEPRTRGKGRR